MSTFEIEFRAWPKTPRLFKDVIITEKIDGTNACVIVTPDGAIGAQSRNRLISPDADNYGFARWATENAGALVDTLGVGYHYGEWWGSGIQRGYGLTHGEKRFSLFNTGRWWKNDGPVEDLANVDGLGVVPVLAARQLDATSSVLSTVIERLKTFGSEAAPGFMNPEGVMVFHSAARQTFKVLFDGDQPKSLAA
jgi:hypothetical protein